MNYKQVFNNTKVDKETAEAIKAMPKVELHIHLEGALSPQLVHRLSVRNGVSLPANTPEEWQDFCTFSDFDHFLDCYRMTTACLVQPIDFSEMLEDFLKHQAMQNIVYSEASFSTVMHLSKVPADELIDALCEGIHNGERKYGSSMQIIPDLSRELVRDHPELQEAVLDFALRAKARGICSTIGMGGRETDNPPGFFQDIFAAAQRSGLHTIAHAGETESAGIIRDSIDQLHVERIGHGIHVLEDPTLVADLAASQIPFEVSPQSNYCTRVTSIDQPHPIRRMIDAGLYCTVNSDDPAMFSTDLNNEYLTLAAQGFTLEELQLLCRNGFDAAFRS